MPLLVQPPPSRVTVTEEVDGLHISIRGKWIWALLFPAAWLCAWTSGGVVAGLSLFRHFSFFICIWMVGWAFGEVLVGYTVLYALGGREIILANSDTLTCRTEIFGVGSSKSYLVREMHDLRFQGEEGSGRSRLPSRIAFDYGAKTMGFATGLEGPEAAELISRIRQRCGIAESSTSQQPGIKFWQQR